MPGKKEKVENVAEKLVKQSVKIKKGARVLKHAGRGIKKEIEKKD